MVSVVKKLSFCPVKAALRLQNSSLTPILKNLKFHPNTEPANGSRSKREDEWGSTILGFNL
jgi:hypothetical protein